MHMQNEWACSYIVEASIENKNKISSNMTRLAWFQGHECSFLLLSYDRWPRLKTHMGRAFRSKLVCN